MDWSNERTHCLELAVYTGCCAYPSDTQLAPLFQQNHEALIDVIKQVCVYSIYSLAPLFQQNHEALIDVIKQVCGYSIYSLW